MDTDQAGGQVYSFCREACLTADLLIYYGASGQDAGVEIGLANAIGTPILGISGPLEGPGLMLHGAVTAWVHSIEEALAVLEAMLAPETFSQKMPLAAVLLRQQLARKNSSAGQ